MSTTTTYAGQMLLAKHFTDGLHRLLPTGPPTRKRDAPAKSRRTEVNFLYSHNGLTVNVTTTSDRCANGDYVDLRTTVTDFTYLEVTTIHAGSKDMDQVYGTSNFTVSSSSSGVFTIEKPCVIRLGDFVVIAAIKVLPEEESEDRSGLDDLKIIWGYSINIAGEGEKPIFVTMVYGELTTNVRASTLGQHLCHHSEKFHTWGRKNVNLARIQRGRLTQSDISKANEGALRDVQRGITKQRESFLAFNLLELIRISGLQIPEVCTALHQACVDWEQHADLDHSFALWCLDQMTIWQGNNPTLEELRRSAGLREVEVLPIDEEEDHLFSLINQIPNMETLERLMSYESSMDQHDPGLGFIDDLSL